MTKEIQQYRYKTAIIAEKIINFNPNSREPNKKLNSIAYRLLSLYITRYEAHLLHELVSDLGSKDTHIYKCNYIQLYIYMLGCTPRQGGQSTGLVEQQV